MTELAHTELEDFAVIAQHDGAHITVKLTGTADIAAMETLDAVFTRVHAARTGITEVVVDLRDVEFMSSSCLKATLTWINDIQELPADQHYLVRFISNPNIHWQARSLHAVRCFASELITVTHDP